MTPDEFIHALEAGDPGRLLPLGLAALPLGPILMTVLRATGPLDTWKQAKPTGFEPESVPQQNEAQR